MPGKELPDIVFINCHDLGRHLGIYGESTAATPALERLAEGGIVLEQLFSTCSICSPARGSILTGRYPHQIGLFGLANENLPWDLGPNERGIPHFLNEAGYETVLFGLQHEAKRDKVLGYTKRVPLKHPHPASVWSVAEQAVEYIASLPARARRQPVYLNIGIFEPHRYGYWENYKATDAASLHLPACLPDTPDVRADMARYEGLIMAMDEGVAMVLDALAKAGMFESSLVLFSTDHGIPFPAAKFSLYDAGIGVTGLVSWPEALPSERRCDALLSHVDWLPTLLEVAGIAKPDIVEGVSFLPLLRDEASYRPREAVFAEGTYQMQFNPMRCVRTRRFKLIRNYDSHPVMQRSFVKNHNNGILGRGDYDVDAILAPRPPWELFDLEADPLERHNVSGAGEYEDVEAQLRGRLTAWLEATDDPIHRMFVNAWET